MRFYSTEYVLKSHDRSQKFNGSIWAVSFEDACRLAMLRNIDEKVLGVITRCSEFNPCPLPSTLYQARSLIECLHTLVFYGWIATKASISNCDGLLSDHGVIHEVLHELHHPAFYSFRVDIKNQLLTLESQIPGLKTYLSDRIADKITA